MPELDPAHVEAVARVFSGDGDVCGQPRWTNAYVGEVIAEAILTSTDPDVHAALLAALVRAGVLDRDDRERAERAMADGSEYLWLCPTIEAVEGEQR